MPAPSRIRHHLLCASPPTFSSSGRQVSYGLRESGCHQTEASWPELWMPAPLRIRHHLLCASPPTFSSSVQKVSGVLLLSDFPLSVLPEPSAAVAHSRSRLNSACHRAAGVCRPSHRRYVVALLPSP